MVRARGCPNRGGAARERDANAGQRTECASTARGEQTAHLPCRAIGPLLLALGLGPRTASVWPFTGRIGIPGAHLRAPSVATRIVSPVELIPRAKGPDSVDLSTPLNQNSWVHLPLVSYDVVDQGRNARSWRNPRSFEPFSHAQKRRQGIPNQCAERKPLPADGTL